MKYILLPIAMLYLSLNLTAQTIPTPTQTDAIIIDNGASGKADPNDRIRYNVTIQNTGGAAATGVQLNAVPDPRTTLVPGSFRTSPVAVNDAYTATGNVPISVPAGSGVKANDFDDALGSTTLSCGTCLSAQNGAVVLNNDGSFTYTPPAGFTGSDNFTYTITDGNSVGTPANLTDVATVTITVSNLIWFVDASAAAGDGRRNTPFNSLAAFNAGSAAAGDIVYVANNASPYTGGIVLQANERLFGEGHTGGANLANVLNFTLAPNSVALPAINGTRPIITNAGGIGIALASNNAIRGVDVGATSGAKISGTNFGTLTVGNSTTPDVLLSGGGQALNLTTGTFAATSKFISVTSTSSGTQGIILTGVAGTVALGSTSISGNTTQGILVGTSTADIDFGNTTVSAGTDAVSVQNNSAGTRTFGTLTISGNSGIGFLSGAGGGNVTVSGTTLITNPGGNGIDIQNSTSTVSFAGTTVNKGASSGTGVNLGGAASGNSGTESFSSLTITTSNGAGLVGTNNTGQITTSAGSISAGSGAALIISRFSGGNTPVTLNFTNVGTTLSAANGIAFTNVSGTFTASGGTLTNCAGTAFLINGGSVVSTYGGNITGNGTLAVDIDNHDSGNITFQTGNITSTTQGIRVQNCGGGTIAFNNPSKSLTTTTNTGVNLLNNSGATIDFTNGGLVISTTTGAGFSATGGGTVGVSGSNNTINSVSNTALNVSSTTIGAGNLNFLSISAGNNTAAADPATGILLFTTGSSGGLNVSGTGSINGSGGTIQNITNRGVDANTTSNLSLSNMMFINANMTDGGTCGASNNSGCNAAIHVNTGTNVIFNNVDINGAAQQGMNLREVNGFQLLNSTIVNGGAGGQTEEADLYALNLFGTCAITNSSLTLPSERAAVIYNTGKTMTMTVSGSTFGMNQGSALGADGLEIDSYTGSNTTLNITGSTFVQPKTNGLQVIGENNSVTNVSVSTSTFDPDLGGIGAAAIDFVSNSTAVMNFNILNNSSIQSRSINVVNISGNGNSTFQGHIINNNIQIASGGTGSGVGVRVIANADSDGKVEIDGNNISGIVNDDGIYAQAVGGTGRLDAKITSNTIALANTAGYHIDVIAGASSSMLTNKVCAYIAGNNTTTGTPLAKARYREATESHELLLQGPGPDITTNWNTNGNLPMSPMLNASGTNTYTYGATCLLPTN